MKTAIIVGAIVVLLILGYVFMINSEDGLFGVNPTPTLSATASPLAQITGSPSPEVKTFTVTGRPFSFTPSQITVNKGDTVRIVFVNESGTHDWKIDEFKTATKVIQGGQTETIEFVADKTGTFEYYCSVGTHRQMGMKGSLTVR